MSYTELESGYQGLRQNRPGFYVGHDGNILPYVSLVLLFNKLFLSPETFCSNICVVSMQIFCLNSSWSHWSLVDFCLSVRM